MKPRAIIGLVLLVGFTIILVNSFGKQVGEYKNFSEVGDDGTTVHVVGEWVPEYAPTYDAASNTFRFRMADELGNEREVHYRNTKPANFEEAERLVIEGHAEGEIFVAERILVKCPSKYNEQNAPDPTTT